MVRRLVPPGSSRPARRVSLTTWAAVGLSLLLVCRSTTAPRADDESDRRRYLADIESKLGSAASELSGFESDSDAGDLDDARNYIREVESLVDRLDDVKGDDSQAKEVASRYPRYVTDWYEAAGYLRQLKDKQRVAAGYVTSCKAWDEAMRERARTAKDAPNAAEELSSFAKSVGRQGEDLLNDARRLRDQLEDAADEVDDFSVSDGGWSKVTDVTRRSGDAMWRGWDRDYQDAVKACEQVVRRERHSAIEEALGRLANNTAGRAELRKRLGEMLALIADRVNDVDSHSSESNVTGAIELTREVGSLLERLRSAQGDDAEAKRIAAEWPAWNEELRVALEGLREAKRRQRGTDEGASKCQAAERELQELIKTILSTPTRHAGGAAELTAYGNRLRSEWQPRLEKAEQGDRELRQGHQIAVAFRRDDGPWRTIRDRLESSANDILNHWKTNYGAAVAACGPLARGPENPDLAAALTQLGRDLSSVSQKSGAFYAELRDWEAEIRTLRDWSARDVEDIRQAFCRAPDAGEYEEVYAVADRWASQLNSKYGTIAGRAGQLKNAADDLIGRGRSRDRMEKVKARIDATMSSLDKVRAHQLQGANNPLLKAYASYGQAEHGRRQGSCDAKEILIQGDCDNPHPKRTDCKLDCMRGCTVVEIKPDSQKSLGFDQANAYRTALIRKYAREKDAMFRGSLSYFSQCVSSDRSELVLRVDVDDYPFCAGITAETLVAPVPEPAVAAEAGE
jgi:hypothetical protein